MTNAKYLVTGIIITNQPFIALEILKTQMHQKFLMTCKQNNNFYLKAHSQV